MAENDRNTTIIVSNRDSIDVDLSNVNYIPNYKPDGVSTRLNEQRKLEAIGLTDGEDVITYQQVKNAIEKRETKSFVFDSQTHFFDWLSGTYTRSDGVVPNDLVVGDDILITEASVPDYWVKSETRPVTIANFEPYESKQDYYTKSEIDSKVETINNSIGTKQDALTAGSNIEINDNVISADLSDYATINYVDGEIQDVTEIAEGKTASYVISDVINPAFASDNDTITLSASGSITDVDSNSIELSTLKKGDIVYIIQTNVPDRWVGSIANGNITFYKMETKAEINNVVHLDGNENITGTKTIQNTSLDFEKTEIAGNAKWHLEEDQYAQLVISRTYNNTKQRMMQLNGSNILPEGNNSNLGSASKLWNNIYLSGNLTDGTNSVTVAQLLGGGPIKPIDLTSTTLTADQVTFIQTYNVVLQSDITLGSGTTLHSQTILTKPFSYSNTLRGLYIDNSKIGTYLIDTNTNVLGQGAQDIVLNGVAQLNSKAIPSYPSTSNKSYNYQFVNTGMQWVEDNTVKVPLFSTSATYDLGDLVSYNNAIYECISEVTTAGSWTGSTNWSEKTLEQLLDSKQDSLTFDSTPTALSTNPVTSAGIKTYVDDRFDGASKAISYGNYSTMITAFNALADDVYGVGQDIYIVTTDVPDLWVSSIESTSSTYTYVDDATFISALATNGYVQVGYYKLSALETQKVDLTDYVTTNTAQTITGQKTFDAQVNFTNSSAQGTNNLTIKNDNGYNAKIKMGSTENLRLMTGGTYFGATVGPISDNTTDLGVSNATWKDLYLKGKITLDNYVINKDSFGQLQIGNANVISIQFDGSTVRLQNIVPIANNQKDLGSSTMQWKDLYIAGKVDFGDSANITKDSSNRLNLNYSNDAKVKIGSAETTIKNRIGADSDNSQDIGRAAVRWKDIYLAGNLSDGTTSVAVNQITPKSMVGDAYDSTSTYAVDDVVIYNNTLYKCTTAVTVAEDFDDTKWTSTTLIAYIQSLVSGAVTTALNTPV